MTILQDREIRISSSILRLVGYGLLLIIVVNISFLLIPLQLMNPLWKFQTVGAIVERTPFILLGMVLVCYGEKSDRANIELSILKGLSWFSLISATALLLAIPLSIHNAFSIYYQNNAADNAQFVSQQDAIEQFQKQLLVADSQDDITAVIQQQGQQKFNILDSINTQKLKNNILISLQNNRDNITSQIQAFRAQKRSLLTKQCLKWDLGALIAASLFLIIWKNTGWARAKVLPNKN